MLEKNRRARCAPGTTGARVRLRTIEFKNRSECRVRLRTGYSPNSQFPPVTAPPAQSSGYIPSRT